MYIFKKLSLTVAFLLMLCCHVAAAQDVEISVHGTVLDTAGEPLPGAVVSVKGSASGAVTDLDGNWSLNVKSGVTLVCSCLGYNDSEAHVTPSSSKIDFEMVMSSELIDEVVVVGYGTMSRKLVTSAISKMTVDDDKLRSTVSPAGLLSGRIAGVSSSGGSGNLGAGERVVIRGTSSLQAGNEPLYVIDGVPITNNSGNIFNFGETMSSLSVLSINDIESIEVLKDAASAAIYGSRASNGVIMITTKSGAEGRSSARVNVSTGMAMFPDRDRMNMADSETYVRAYNEGVDNYNEQYGYRIGDANYKVHIYNPFHNLPDTDWMDVITRVGWQMNADASLSGGNKKTKYYIGANYNHQEGVIKTNRIEKFNFRSKITHDFTDWLEVGANSSANYMKNWQVPGSNLGSTILARAVLQRPFDRIWKPDGSYYVGGTDGLTYHNPIQLLSEETATLETMRFIGTYHMALKFLEDRLMFKNTLNLDATQLYDYTYYTQNHPYGLGVGRIIDNNNTTVNLSVDSVLSFSDKYAGGDLSFDAMAGHSFQKIQAHSIGIDGNGFPSPSFSMIGVASEIADYSGSGYEFALESYFTRVNFAYLDKYILTATLRTDGSSKFSEGHRWGWFPSISFGWNMGKEPWMEDSGINMKYRISYGQTGNQAGIGNYASQAQMSGGMNYLGNSGIYTTSMGNTNLTWEKSGQFDVGADMSFFRDKLSLIVDFYEKNTSDLLYARPAPATSGTTSITSNIGSIRNRGVELTVGTDFDFSGFHWASSLNISHNRNTVTRLTGDEDLIAIGSNRVLKVGEEVGTFYLFQFDGLYQYDSEVPDALYEQGVRAGDVKYANLDGDEANLISDTDRAVKYSPNPLFHGGWSNTFSWKGLSLDVFLSYMYGNKVYMSDMTTYTKFGVTTNIRKEYADNRWTGPGTTNVWPRAIAGSAWNAKNSDMFLFDGSFIRLRSLTLSYTFDRKVVEKMKMKALRVYAQGDNLFLLTRYPGFDPEVSSNLDARFFGVDNLIVPQPRTVTFGVNMTF